MTGEITDQELANARQIWGDALIAISKAFEQEGIDGARVVANGALDTAYGYELGPVLFKPTLASGKQTFRTTRDGALAYFVGHSDAYPCDSGFGIKGWRSVVSETAASFIQDDIAMWMGWVVDGQKETSLRSTKAGVIKGQGRCYVCPASFVVALSTRVSFDLTSAP